MPERQYTIEDMLEDTRVDRFLARKMIRTFTRSQVKKIIDSGGVKVDGRQVSAHFHVKPGHVVDIQWEAKEDDTNPAQDIPLNIIHEDKDLLVINKPAGLVVHPANGNPDGTLVNALLFHIKKLSTVGGPIRPGIVHRLDKDTSGVMVVAKSDQVHAFLADQFQARTVERIYSVIVGGVVQHEEGYCEEPVGHSYMSKKRMVVKPSGGREALTYFRVVERFKDATLLELKLHTGRTHQIRVHMGFLGHPVVGDALYGIKSPWITRQCVHAASLGFIHPRTKKQATYTCPVAEDIEEVLDALRAGK